MVTTASSSTDARYRTYPGDGYEGVVHVSFGGYYGSGALLFDGRAILTSAHLFSGKTGTASITFVTREGVQTFDAAKIAQHPGYDTNSNNDLAIVWLARSAPKAADRYALYNDSNEIGQSFTFAGYGLTGVGANGATSRASSLTPLKASNDFDAEAATLKNYLGTSMGWTPLAGTQLVADFDNGYLANDALGQLIYRSGLGLGLDEGMIAQGDSGGPAFVAGKLAGVASYTASLINGDVAPDIDDMDNSSFGELGVWQRVSAYQQWIDQTLRINYQNAPTKAEDVRTQIVEGDDGGIVYFMLKFTGVRSKPDQILSVDYATRDGSATSDSDYISVRGRLNLYPGEDQAVIPIEIIDDALSEPGETFYLDVFNPVGGSFGEGVVKLTAVRTIIDNDGWFA